MNTQKLNAVIKEIEGKILLDLMHAIEDLVGRKSVQRLVIFEKST